jgi:hypothetical protein
LMLDLSRCLLGGLAMRRQLTAGLMPGDVVRDPCGVSVSLGPTRSIVVLTAGLRTRG